MSVGPYIRRFPFIDLWEYCRVRFSGDQPFCYKAMATMLDIDPGNVGKSVTSNRLLSVWQADRWAIRVGAHPSEIWGEDWWDLDKDREMPYASWAV